ncbi:hypothetical protein DBR32_05400 [Taibaiella sp. KBW10]|uniref:hypothetical protein n=1 Tax=Taibaiella sp. KBW10 TaxID=2153357 RepID=UPI000F5B69E0|nr:hypothetical protein [Taibaiella sp. KBW10]RQO31400.1 hypothetical protein DBR32_05400 [Taibaiella sp. KBW10]
MKKNPLLLIILTLVAFTFLQSCKRDYSCTCVSFNNATYSKADTTIKKATKTDAIYYCDQIERQKIYDYTVGLSNDTVMYCNLGTK